MNRAMAHSLFTLTLADSFTRSPTVAVDLPEQALGNVDLPEQARRAVPIAATAAAAGA